MSLITAVHDSSVSIKSRTILSLRSLELVVA